MADVEPKKTKTKAKQHYLKAKRQRRKKRLKVGEAAHEVVVKGKIREKQQTWFKQPEEVQVRRNLSDESPSESEEDPPLVIPQTKESAPSSAMDMALPRFEIPASGDTIFMADLALQGLDPGLLEAEIVDFAKTASIDNLPFESLSSKTRKRLKDLGITEFFAVQLALLPFLLSGPPKECPTYTPYNPPRDVCVSAPTGSGKTLAYVIPILESLSTRVIIRLRALVVLPTRDLVTQVRETFEALCKGRGLKIGSMTGQHSFAHEQSQLVNDSAALLTGGSSKVDIVICTPGRLMDHLKGTKNFTLQHLQYLVIDEADRLLTQSFQDWLAQVLNAIRSPVPLLDVERPSLLDTLPRSDAVSPSRQSYPPWRTHLDSQRESTCQKLLFSATLTHDPAKIAELNLRNAKYFIVSNKAAKAKTTDGQYSVAEGAFTFPSTLSEHMLVCTAYLKPLMLFFLIHKRGVTNALVFTKSTESTNRLVKLFECFENVLENNVDRPVVSAYSSDLSTSERKMVLDKFKAQEITILICSDLISRGIDISQVNHVVSYDVPVDMRKYVHRVGRTARAGRQGDAWSLVEEQEARYFKIMMADANHLDRVKKMNVADKELKALKETYEAAMFTYNRQSKHGGA